MSTVLDAPLIRLRDVPWPSLGRLAGPLSDALQDVLAGSPAERVLDALLRRLKPLASDERRALAEAVFGVGLWRRRLAWHLGSPDPSAPDPRLLVFALVRDLAGRDAPSARHAAGLPPDAPLPPLRPPPEDFATRASLPDWLASHLRSELGDDDAVAFAAAINVPGPVTLRANPLVVPSRNALAAQLRQEGVETVPGRYAPHALVVSGPRPNIYGLTAHQSGAFEVQDEGSQLLAELLEARPGDTVLDLCAGAGGKSLPLAAAVAPGGGRVLAWDIDPSRLDRLATRAARARASPHIRVLRQRPDPRDGLVDRALVDAPCSELGTLRRGPDLRWRIDPATLATFPPLQLDLLAEAARLVRPGGRLVYATCTLNRAENADVALAFEASHGDDFTRVCRPGEFWRDGFFRALPHLHGTDGFFAAVWQRRA